jgi:hypothetical protein
MIIEIIILLLGIPTGLLISYFDRDELIGGSFWFLVLALSSFIVGSWFYLTDNFIIMNSCWFIMIVSLVSYYKSKDKKWTRKKI